MPGLHEQYISISWRQVLGSATRSVVGDGIGILTGAGIASYLTLPRPADLALEYALGFGFGWSIFSGAVQSHGTDRAN